MKHINPYRINDPTNIFEVGENSSHPEIRDSKRIWRFRGYTFTSATQLESFFKNEGLNPKAYWMTPRLEKDLAGKVKVIIEITDKRSKDSTRMDQSYAS